MRLKASSGVIRTCPGALSRRSSGVEAGEPVGEEALGEWLMGAGDGNRLITPQPVSQGFSGAPRRSLAPWTTPRMSTESGAVL